MQTLDTVVLKNGGLPNTLLQRKPTRRAKVERVYAAPTVSTIQEAHVLQI